MPFLFFLLITSCVENQRERKKTAIALKREMPLNAHQSGNRIISLIIRIIIINKNEFSHFQSNNSKIKTKFFSSSSSPFLLLAAAQEALLGLHSILGTNCIPANRVRVNLSFREYKEDWSAHGFLCSNRWRHRGFDGTFNQSHATWCRRSFRCSSRPTRRLDAVAAANNLRDDLTNHREGQAVVQCGQTVCPEWRSSNSYILKRIKIFFTRSYHVIL